MKGDRQIRISDGAYKKVKIMATSEKRTIKTTIVIAIEYLFEKIKGGTK